MKNLAFSIALGTGAVLSKEGSQSLNKFLNDIEDSDYELSPEELNIFLGGL